MELINLTARQAPPPPPATVPITRSLVELKVKLFCHGLRVPEATWREIADENHYRHKRAGLSQGRFLRLRDGLATTLVNAPVREPFVQRSPLWLARDGADYYIADATRGDERVAGCEPYPWPKWYAQTTSDGTPMQMVVSSHGPTSLYTAIYQGGCDFFKGGKECQFCAMKIDNKQEWRKVEQIIEVAKVAQAENPRVEISFGGGTRLTPDRGAHHDIAAISKFRAAVDMPVCVEMAPPDTDDWIDGMRDAGVTSVLFNLELWNPSWRTRIMPGKAAITRERYIAAMEYAVKVFGPDQVSSQIIIGLEPIEDTIAGVNAIIGAGAIPMPVVLRPLANTPLVDHPLPSVEDAMRVFDAALTGMRAKQLGHSTAGCALCGACSAVR